MASRTRARITSFPRSHEFSPASFTIDGGRLRAYLDAIGDAGTYGDAVPPLCAVALGLEALQAEVELPEGSLHTGQEVEQSAALLADEALTMTARVAQRSERQGFVITVLEFEISTIDGVALRARTTIMAPGAQA